MYLFFFLRPSLMLAAERRLFNSAIFMADVSERLRLREALRALYLSLWSLTTPLSCSVSMDSSSLSL